MITSLNLYKDSIFNSTNRHCVAIDTTLYRAPNLKYDRLIQNQIIISDLDGTTYKIFDEYIDVKAEILQANSNYLLTTYARLEYDYEDGEMPFVKYYRINRIEDRPNIIRLYWELDTFMTYWQYVDFFAPNHYSIKINRTNKLVPNIYYYGDKGTGFTVTSQPVRRSLFRFNPDIQYLGINVIFSLKYNTYNQNNNEVSTVQMCCWKVELPKLTLTAYDMIYDVYTNVISIFEFANKDEDFKKCEVLNCYIVPDNLITQGNRFLGKAHTVNNNGVQTINIYNAENYNLTGEDIISVNNAFYNSNLKIGNKLYELPFIVGSYDIRVVTITSNYNVQIVLRISGYSDMDVTGNFKVPIMNSSSETSAEQANRILNEGLQGIAALVGVVATVLTGGAAAPALIGSGLAVGNMISQEQTVAQNHILSTGGASGEIGFNTWDFLKVSFNDNAYIELYTYINTLDEKEEGLKSVKRYYQQQGAVCQIGLSSINDLNKFPNFIINSSDPDFEVIGNPSHTYAEFDCLPRGLSKEICEEIRSICNEGIYIKWL